MSTVVAIDGPAGAGKSTVARLLAERMGYAYVNTGSLYRALALSAKRAGIDPGALTAEFLAQQQLEFKGADLYLNGNLTGAELRAPLAIIKPIWLYVLIMATCLFAYSSKTKITNPSALNID